VNTNIAPIVVYHVAAMGNWEEVVVEQLELLASVGLTEVRLTHVGLGLEWLLAQGSKHGVKLEVVRSDPNISHYETFAMLEIERLCKKVWTHAPILYLHTKGVSAPHDRQRTWWRRVMQEHVVRRWRDHIGKLYSGYDAVGVNWRQHGEQHFSGTFWLASPEWIRRLPDFVAYHHSKNLTRYSCEMWIGAAHWCRAFSLGCADHDFCAPGYDFYSLLPEWRPEWNPPKPEVLVWNREQAERDRLPGPSMVVSFSDSKEQTANFRDATRIVARLDLLAHDARDGHGLVRPPTATQAQQILDFLAPPIRAPFVVMQCEKGIGRSRGAAAGMLWIRGDRDHARAIMDLGTHNRPLCHMLCEAAGSPLPSEDLVSVVARVKYSPDRLLGLILCLQRQRHQNWELILVTDGPDSAARELVELFAAKGELRLRLIETPEAKGKWGHPYRQLGIDAARGEWITLTNDDNYYVPGWIEQMLIAGRDNDVVLCDTLHSYFGWGIHNTTPVVGGADLGCCMARAAVMRSVPWPGDDQSADGRFIEALATRGRVGHVSRPLFVHN
jgi:predicted protein tyrosine phosphatase